MDLASVVAALASVGVRVSGSTPNSSVQVDSSRACPTGLAGPEPSGTINDPGQHFHNTATKTENVDASEWFQEGCPMCLDRPPDTCLSCDPRHRLCQTCANDPRLLRCPLCRSMLELRVPPPPSLDDQTYAYFYIQIYNNQLLTYADYSLTPNPPILLAYNVWRQITSTTGQLWEVHLRNTLPYYHTARQRLHGLTYTIDGFKMAISIGYWLY